jgi:hypothetical protein
VVSCLTLELSIIDPSVSIHNVQIAIGYWIRAPSTVQQTVAL